MGLDTHLVPAHWRPHFVDHLYASSSSVVAFSPTDTLPLTRWAKALVIARAVNILT